MSYDPISYLGLSCPSGGKLYICQGSKIEFLGCCDVDPCSSQCPSSALHPASFNPDRYDNIPAQSCVGSTSLASWYTCQDGPTFLGCCVSNPCNNEGICPKDNLVDARLANDPSSASPFLTATTANTVTTATTATTAVAATSTSTSRDESTSAPISGLITTTQMPSPIPTNTASKGSSSAPTAGIIGGVLGGLIVLILIVFVFFRYRGRRTRQFARAHSDEFTSQSTWSPYRDTFRSSPTVPSPLSTASKRHKSLSASLSSILGFKRWSAVKRQSFQASDWVPGTHDGRQASPGIFCPVTELESLPPGGIIVRGPHNAIHYEVEGTAVGTGTR
ncbi:hypothetical protein F4860DRAFT_5 [Xylaria cubensis]|nr:hypothetical protein F4860DRAFT_5 [Xylaria cubensis]